MKFALKKYVYIANDITNMLLKKEHAKEDRRVRNLAVIIIVIAAVLIASLAINVYFVTGA